MLQRKSFVLFMPSVAFINYAPLKITGLDRFMLIYLCVKDRCFIPNELVKACVVMNKWWLHKRPSFRGEEAYCLIVFWIRWCWMILSFDIGLSSIPVELEMLNHPRWRHNSARIAIYWFHLKQPETSSAFLIMLQVFKECCSLFFFRSCEEQQHPR